MCMYALDGWLAWTAGCPAGRSACPPARQAARRTEHIIVIMPVIAKETPAPKPYATTLKPLFPKYQC